MIWLLAAIACIIPAVKFHRFRYFLLTIAGLLVLTGVVYRAHRKQEEESSKHLVSADQLIFTDLRFGPLTNGSFYRFSGRVKNNSPFYVFQVQGKFHILDCDAQSHCDVVGEEEEWNICPIIIPPGQVRDVDTSIYFGSGTRVRGRFQWNYEITQIRARSKP
jgi:hypothetical protein